VPDQVKPSFLIFDIRELRRSALSDKVPGCQKLQTMAQDALCSWTHGNSGRQRVK